MAQVPVVALRGPLISPDARGSTSRRCDEGRRCDNSGTSADFSDKVEKDIGSRP